METKESLTVRLKTKTQAGMVGRPESSGLEALVVNLIYRSGARMLRIERIVNAPQGKMILELNISHYLFEEVKYTDHTGGVWVQDFDETLAEQGEAVETIEEYLNMIKAAEQSAVQGPDRVEISFKYLSAGQSSAIHRGVVVGSLSPAGQFAEYSLRVRHWEPEGSLNGATTTASQAYCRIISVSAYQAQAIVPWIRKHFPSSETDEEAFKEVHRLYGMLSDAERKIAECWEYRKSSQFGGSRAAPTWVKGPEHSVSVYKQGGYSYVITPPKPAQFRRSKDKVGEETWLTMQRANSEGRALSSLQEAEAGEKKEPQSGATPAPSINASVFCNCGSGKCIDCNPEAYYFG